MGQVRSNIYRVGTLIGLVATMPVGRVLAEETGLSATPHDVATTTTTNSVAVAGLITSFGVAILIIVAISIAFFVWWIFMLVDALRRTNWTDDSQKTSWLAILIVGLILGFGWLVTILYYFMIRKPLGKAVAGVTPAATATPTTTGTTAQPPQNSSNASPTTTPTTKK